MNISSKPFLFIAADAPAHQVWKPVLDQWQAGSETLQLTITEKDVLHHQAASATTVLELLQVLQHHPDAVARLLFNIDICFVKADGSLYQAGDNSWINKARIEWLGLLGNGILFPMVVFFLRDPAKRYFSITGDLIFRRQYIGTSEQRVINERVYNAGRHFLLYCYGLNIDVAKYISQLMQECKVTFGYSSILDAHAHDVEAGLPFRYQPLYGSIDVFPVTTPGKDQEN